MVVYLQNNLYHRMFENNLYNLMMQATQEHLSLWRIKKEYLEDASQNPEAKAFWGKMITDKEAHINELKVLIKKELQ